MSEPAKVSSVFIDASTEDNSDVLTFVCSRLTGSQPRQSRVTITLPDGTWLNFDFPGTVVSACRGATEQSCYVLCEDGSVAVVTRDGLKFERIPDAGLGRGRYGYVTQIRNIAGDFFVCGDLHQVYCRRSGRWVHWDQSIAIHDKTEAGYCFNSINGLHQSDVYAVGDDGEIYHHDGSKWSKIDSPTNVALRQIVCRQNGEVYIVGARGAILRGDKNKLLTNSDSDMEDNLWGVAEFRDDIYVSSASTVYRLKNDELDEVPIGLPRDGSLLRLVASPHYLWAIGAGNVFRFDGQVWLDQVYDGVNS